MHKKILAGFAAAALSLASAAPALALSVDVDGSASGSAQAQSGSVTGNASLDAVVNTNLGTGVRNVVKGIVGTYSSSSSGSNKNTSANTEGSANIDTNTSAAVSVIVVTRGDVQAGTVQPSNTPAASVSSDSDLSAFVAAQVQSDDNVAEVETSAHNVTVVYAQPAKLFGFIPITLNAAATVDATGNVTVNFPWYAFLAVTNSADVEAAVHGNVDAVIAGNGSASANAEVAAELSSSTQAKLVAAIKEALETSASASASANASGAVSTQ